MSNESQSSSGLEAAEGDEYEPDLIDQWMELNSEFQARIEAIEEEGASFQDGARMRAGEEFMKATAELAPPETFIDQTAGIINENVPHITKGAAKGRITDAIRENTSRDRDSDAPEITDLLDGDLDRIEKLHTGETGSEPRHRFVFKDGSSFVVNNEQLRSKTKFPEAYYDAKNRLPKFEGTSKDWRAYLSELLDIEGDYLVVREDNVGPRSAAIETLRAEVNSTEAYLNPAEAAMKGAKGSGQFIDAEDRESAEESEIIWVQSEVIQTISEKHGIDTEHLRIELDDRDSRCGQRTKQLRTTGGKRASFWPLDRSEFREKHIEASGEDPSGESEP